MALMKMETDEVDNFDKNLSLSSLDVNLKKIPFGITF